MSRAATSLFVFGIYLVLLSLVLLIAPNALLAVFGVPPTDEVWIRVVGMLLLFLAVYDIQAARTELTAFFRWSVYLRATVIVFLTAFVLLGMAPPSLILFGVVDLCAAIWTAVALRADQRRLSAPVLSR